ncbi:dihydrofolate reductase family protein [Amycolatopsis sp.]|uniref:dihydrofolate reductase family protein n=1 Tax=Amycolatopsis sp. TaxID=37632 RepID=UPI002CAB2329|nr:dihydrofolate reductase family protein [Amycolatopsis sp.]HVV07839.1 dihydrofolate reductase family protein [Amycolatopsis sp.]
MSLVICRTCISLDGYTAAPNQRQEEPFGDGGMRLPQWQFETTRPGHEADAALLDEFNEGVGAFIMGRNMFAPGRGAWDESWTGWWGENPPYHAPVFVLSHYARESLPMEGGTTFSFVTEGIESALKQAREVAGDRKIVIAGGANTIHQYLVAGHLDEMWLHIVPVTLGAGERPLDNAGKIEFEPFEVIASPTVTHVKYRVLR